MVGNCDQWAMHGWHVVSRVTVTNVQCDQHKDTTVAERLQTLLSCIYLVHY